MTDSPLRYAGFGQRFGAWFLDIALIAIVDVVAVAFIVGTHPDGEAPPAPPGPFWLFMLVVWWLYFALLESSRRQGTLGKMALGLRVTDLKGSPISFARASIRFFAKLLSILPLYLGFVLAGFTARKQALHDLIAGTLVLLRESAAPAASQPSPAVPAKAAVLPAQPSTASAPAPATPVAQAWSAAGSSRETAPAPVMESANSSRASGEPAPYSAEASKVVFDSQSQTDKVPESKRLEALLAMATPDMYRRNPFRVTGLRVTATPREMARQADKLKMLEKLGTPPAPASLGLPLDPPPDAEAIRAAMQRLQDPETRLIDEVFWIWPLPGSSDDSLDCFNGGDAKRAEESWRRAYDGADGDVARHNFAVLQHARLLESDSVSAPDWTEAFRRWQLLLTEEAFWSRVAVRIRELDDPRLTTGTARRLRLTLPLALVTFNARLAVQAAEHGDLDRARRQRDIALASGLDHDSIDEALVAAVAPIRDRLRTLCKAADADSDADPAHADQVVDRLLEQARAPLQVLETILPQASALRTGAFDDVALKALGCQIVFGNKTENWEVCSRLLAAILAVAVGESARSRIQQSIETIARNKEVTTCWFCGTGRFDEASKIEVKMHGNVKRTPTWQGTQVTWSYSTITVPRCASCRKIHTAVGKPFAIGCLGSLCGFLISLALPDNVGPFVFLFLLAASIIAAAVVKKRLRGGIKPARANLDFPAILEKKKQGWSFGERPA